MAARLIVSAAADTDTGKILDYLAREAGPLIASEYGRRFERTLDRVVDNFRVRRTATDTRSAGPYSRRLSIYLVLRLHA